jgi:hypothetical protein
MVQWSLRRRVEIAYALALGGSLVLLMATGAAWGLLLLSIIAAAHLLPARDGILGVTVSRFFMSAVMILSLYQIEAVIAFVCHVHAYPQLYVVLVAVAVGAAWVVARRRGSTARLSFGRQDVALLLPGVLMAGFYVARVVLPSEADGRSMIRATSMALDDTSHMGMLNALVRNDANLLVDQAEANNLMAIPGHSSYPMGWHLSNAVVVASIDPSAKDAHLDDFIVIYFIVKVASLLLAVLALTIFTFQVASSFGISIGKVWPIVGLYTGIAFTAVLVILPQFLEGFFSFAAVFIYTLAFVSLLVDGWRTADHQKLQLGDVVLLLCVTGSALSWLLTAPALLIAFLIAKFHQAQTLRRISWITWIGVGIAGLMIVFQAWDIVHAAGLIVSAIAAPGGITAPDPVLLFVLMIAFVFLMRKERLIALASPVIVAVLPFLFSASVILGYIGLHSATLSYYFYKFEFAILVVLLPLAVVGLMDAVETTVGDLSPLLRSGAQYAMFATVLILAIPSVIGYGYAQSVASRTLSYTLTRDDAKALDAVLSLPFSPTNERVFFYIPESVSRTIMTSHDARMIYPNTPCDSEMFTAAYSNDVTAMGSTLQKCIGEFKNVIFYTDKEGRSKLEAALSPTLVQSHQVEIREEAA